MKESSLPISVLSASISHQIIMVMVSNIICRHSQLDNALSLLRTHIEQFLLCHKEEEDITPYLVYIVLVDVVYV